MNYEEQDYLDLLEHILANGSEHEDRTGVGTKSIFGTQLRFSLEDGKIPLLTTKKVFYRGVIEELLFFLRGETDTKKLEAKGINIWKGNTSREFLDKRGLINYMEGDMGPMYGAIWRNFSANPINKGTDQLKKVIDLIKSDPYSRRIIVSAYNPDILHLGCLEPCHMFFQFYVDNGELSCQFTCRSTDMFLGFPFNILSYAILTHIIAKTKGLKAREIIFVGGDVHCYNNHIKQVKEQISRKPYDFPFIKINKELTYIEDIEKLSLEDFKIIGYKCHDAIKAPMSI